MNVSKIATITLSTAVTPPPSLLGEAEAKSKVAGGLPKAAEGKAAGEQHVAGESAVAGAKPASPFERVPPQRDVGEAVEKVNEAMEAFGTTSLKFSYDYERQLMTMQVVRAAGRPGEPGEVIRQIPPEDLLQLVEKLEELQGILFDRHV
jgi:uncharacterized FlaG/YvyC family protein